jgi:serine/threonine kinase PknH
MSNQAPPNQWGQPPPPAVAPRPPRPSQRRTWWFVIAAVVLVIAVAVGVTIAKLTGDKGTAQAKPAENSRPSVDLSGLDIGSYDVKPHDFPGPPTLEEARNMEAFNLAQWIVAPPDVFPALTYINGIPLPTAESAATAVSANGNTVIKPVLEKYQMVSGFVLQGFPRPIKEFNVHPNGTLLNLMLTSFPGETQAAQAATEMDATDFAVNPANVAVPIPGYPDAHAHWIPGIASIGVTMARKEKVVSITFFDPASNTADLLGAQIQRTLDAEVPLLDRGTATPEAALTMMPIDPDHMLSRLLVKGPPPPVGPTFARVSGNATIICESAEAIQQNLNVTAGVDRCAGSPDGTVQRARDDAAAKDLQAKLHAIDAAKFLDHEIAAPQGVPGALCIERKADQWKDDPNSRFVCSVTFGRYVANVQSADQKDALQRAAAQYALLVNNE